MHGSKNVPGKEMVTDLLKPVIISPSKIKRVYEDDNWIIDILTNEDGSPMLRVSVFKDGHFLDEEFVRKKDYLD